MGVELLTLPRKAAGRELSNHMLPEINSSIGTMSNVFLRVADPGKTLIFFLFLLRKEDIHQVHSAHDNGFPRRRGWARSRPVRTAGSRCGDGFFNF